MVPHTQQQLISSLPNGIEQIGNGIGFTYTRSPSQPLVTPDATNPIPAQSTAAPRRSLSLIPTSARYGSLAVLPRLLRNNKRGNIDEDSQVAGTSQDGVDELETSMRETYGSSWDLNSTGAAARSAAGLGFGLSSGHPTSSLLRSNSHLASPIQGVAGEDFFSTTSTALGTHPREPLGGVFFSGSTLRLVTPTTTQQQRELWQG